METTYSHVIGWIVCAERMCGFRKILVDKSGVGEAVMEEIGSQGLENAEGQTSTSHSFPTEDRGLFQKNLLKTTKTTR